MLYDLEGGDSRNVWFNREMQKARDYLNEMKCLEAARAFGRGLHSRQDRSAHRPWADGGSWYNAGAQLIAHPGWWDAWVDSDYPNSYPSDEFWKRYNDQPDYAAWLNTSEQNASQAAVRAQVITDSHDAIGLFVEAVQSSCCRNVIMLIP